MEAPEKIYLQEPTKVRTEKKYDNDVEYIRTDVFIGKTCEWLETNIAELTGIDSYAITESFKQAMEE